MPLLRGETFQRLVGKSEYEGTGMGMSISRRIVDRHGGSIVQTEPVVVDGCDEAAAPD